MSVAKVLNKKQQRQTLSNAKKKKKAPARNVYGHPRKDHRPVLTEENQDSLLNLLTKLFRASSDLKGLNKDTSSSTKNWTSDSVIVHQPALHNQIPGNQLVVGLRKVIAEIESGSLKGLLLDNNVDPPSLGYIVGNLASVHNVPFVAISNLKSCLEDLLGFKSWCVGFKDSSEHFDPICEKIKTLLNMQHKTQSQQESFVISENATKSRIGGTPKDKSKNVSELYFYRSNKSKRMFVPESSSNRNDAEDLFLSFSKDPSDNVIYQKEISLKYQNKPGLAHKLSPDSRQPKQYPRYFTKVELLPLQVKRFQENPNKQSWKKSKNRSSDTASKLCEGT